MEIDHKIAEYFLLRWAQYTRGSGCVGWSSKSVTGALMDQYEVGIKNEGDFAVEHIPDDVAIMDSVITNLPGVTKRVILIYWTNANAPVEVHARRLNCHRSHFYRLFKAAMLVCVARLEPFGPQLIPYYRGV